MTKYRDAVENGYDGPSPFDEARCKMINKALDYPYDTQDDEEALEAMKSAAKETKAHERGI